MPDPQSSELDYATTPHKVNGYHLWFKDYMPSATNTLLVGGWLAWPGVSGQSRRLFWAPCGIDRCWEYRSGDELPEWDKVPTDRSTPQEDLDRFKAEAFERLKKYMEALT